MSHCTDFFKKWRRQPNFCGLGRVAQGYINGYLRFVDDFASEYGFDENIIYTNVTASAVRQLLRFNKESDTRKRVEKQIAQTLKDKHAITGKYVNHLIGISPVSLPIKNTPIVAAISDIPKEAFSKGKQKDRIRLIVSAITSGQHKILLEIMEKECLDDEYAALTTALIWAQERIRAGRLLV